MINQGLHHEGRRRAVHDGAQGRPGRVPAEPREGVRGDYRAGAAVRVAGHPPPALHLHDQRIHRSRHDQAGKYCTGVCYKKRNVPAGWYVSWRLVRLHDFSWCNFPPKRTNLRKRTHVSKRTFFCNKPQQQLCGRNINDGVRKKTLPGDFPSIHPSIVQRPTSLSLRDRQLGQLFQSPLRSHQATRPNSF